MLETPTSNRRRFLTQCSTIALASGLTPAAVLASPSARREVSLQSINFGQFSAQVGTTFRIRQTSGSVLSLVLMEATPKVVSGLASLASEDAGNERFSLVFLGPASVPLEQDTYTFEHPRLGQVAMFIVPLHSMSGEQVQYEAVFNRAPVARARRAL